MRNTCSLLLFFMAALPLSASPNLAYAQTVKGLYTPKAQKEEKKEEKYETLIPKIFSSQLQSVTQGERVDKLYYDFKAALWNYSQIGFQRQKLLLNHLKSDKFKTTRYPEEFQPDLKKSMDDLNENYKALTKMIEDADKQVVLIREALLDEEKEKFDWLWKSYRDEFKETSDTYFNLQYKFLITYRNLVKFVLSQNGRYSYDPATQSIAFFEPSSYSVYKETLAQLKDTVQKQRELLQDIGQDLQRQIIR